MSNLSKTQEIHLKLQNIEVACEQSKHALESVARISDTVNTIKEVVGNLETESRIYRLQHHDLLKTHNDIIHGGGLEPIGLKTRTDRLEQKHIDLEKKTEARRNGIIAVAVATASLWIEKIFHAIRP